MTSNKQHWENIYSQKKGNELSWTQQYPSISMQFISEIKLPKNAKIIDIGGGEGFLADALLDAGFTNITVLDISKTAIEDAKKRLAEKAKNIKWIVADITEFENSDKFDFWHDRAVFHFLTVQNQVEKYKSRLTAGLIEKGFFLLGTFSPMGPFKCSGLNIVQYSKEEMQTLFIDNFLMINDYEQEHLTPFNTIQNFQFGGFKKNN